MQGLHAPLVTFITAGDPTTPTNGGTSPLFHAVEAANTVKSHGSHIFAAGVGNVVNKEYLKDISGEGGFDVTHDLVGLSHDLLEQILTGPRMAPVWSPTPTDGALSVAHRDGRPPSR